MYAVPCSHVMIGNTRKNNKQMRVIFYFSAYSKSEVEPCELTFVKKKYLNELTEVKQSSSDIKIS